MSASADAAYLYQDIVVAIDAERGITNGLPSLHARSMVAVNPRPGESVVHIGAGTGYFTAILAELVGVHGTVLALELDPALAQRARRNLAAWPWVTVENADGIGHELNESDVLYVSAGVSSLPLPWLEALRARGRLLFPLVPGEAEGALFCITRNADTYGAAFVANARFYPCIGTQHDPQALIRAFARGGARYVQALRLDDPDHTCWYAGDGWWLQSRCRH